MLITIRVLADQCFVPPFLYPSSEAIVETVGERQLEIKMTVIIVIKLITENVVWILATVTFYCKIQVWTYLQGLHHAEHQSCVPAPLSPWVLQSASLWTHLATGSHEQSGANLLRRLSLRNLLHGAIDQNEWLLRGGREEDTELHNPVPQLTCQSDTSLI